MSNYFNYSSSGSPIVGEKVFVSNLSEIVLSHDNIFDVSLFYDSELSNEIDETLYVLGEYDSNYQGYNKIDLDSTIYNSYTHIYATYKTRGDYVDAEDINDKQDMIISKECGENIIAYRAVMIKNDKLWYPDLTVISDVWKIEGISVQSGSIGQNVKVHRSGILKNDLWSWDTTKDIFISTSGILTQTIPSSGTIKIIATPLDSNTVKIVELSEITRS